MKAIYEKTYYHLPVFLQNLFVSLYGLKLLTERYGKSAKEHLGLLLKTEGYSAEAMLEFQTASFVRLARFAIKMVPFYQDWAANQGIKAKDIQDLKDLKLFPILAKETVRRKPEMFISKIHKPRHDLIKLSTSGTTGKPLTVLCDQDSRIHHYAFFSRLRRWFGLEPISRRATLFGRIIVLPEQNQPPFWRYDISQRNLLMSSYHLSQANLYAYYHKLRLYKPAEIIAYPSSVYQIAQYINRNGLEPLKPKVVITTAESLLPYQRTAIESAFNAPLVNQYGCTEMSFFASQCEHGSMHFHPEHGIIEVIDELGNSVVESPGNVVATGLINKVMPLIRYEIGDRITLAKPECTCVCGRSFPIIRRVEGRIDDILYRRDGTPVGRLDPVFKGGSNIIAAKILQKKAGDIEVSLQPSDSFCTKNLSWLEYELRKRMGDGIGIMINLVSEIPKDKNGKFRAVESHYRP